MSHCGMPSRSLWGLTPRESIELECTRRGTADVVAGCVGLLRQQDADDALVFAIGGPGARSVLGGGQQRDRGGPAVRLLARASRGGARPRAPGLSGGDLRRAGATRR